jgi:hypothetical protein
MLEIVSNWTENRISFINVPTVSEFFIFDSLGGSSSKGFGVAMGVDFSTWNKFKGFIDFTTPARSNAWINGVPYTAGGVFTNLSFVTTGATIYLGTRISSGYHAFCNFRNLRILPVEF